MHFLLRVQKPAPPPPHLPPPAPGSGGEATLQSEFSFLGKSEHTILPGSCCGTGEGNSGVIQGSVFPQKFNDFSLTPNHHSSYLFQAKPHFDHSSRAPRMGMAAFFLGLMPQTCPKNAARARSYPSQLPFYLLSKKATTLTSFLKLRSPLKNCQGASHFSSPSPMQFIPYNILCLFLCLWFTHLLITHY